MVSTLKQRWQLYEILRPLGLAEIPTNDLLAFAHFKAENMLSWSEAMTQDAPDGGRKPHAPWSGKNISLSSALNPYIGAEVTEVASINSKPTPSTDLWVVLSEDDATWGQDNEVSPGEVYTFSFFAQPVNDWDNLRLAVIDAETKADIIPPRLYGPQLVPGDFVRISVSFRAPPDCSRVRLELVTESAGYSRTASNEIWVEYTPRPPHCIIRETKTIYVGGVAYPISTVVLTE